MGGNNMPVDMAWEDSSKSIMLCTSHGEWTWDEYHTALEQAVEQFQAAQHSVDLILARAPTATMPSGSPMPHFQRAMRMMPSNVGLIIFINTSGFSRALVSIFSRIFMDREQPRLVIVASHEEAHAVIASHRAVRGQLQPDHSAAPPPSPAAENWNALNR